MFLQLDRESEAAAMATFGLSAHAGAAAYSAAQASTYSGFGESANRFFSYGCMNERAFNDREAAEAMAQQTSNGDLFLF